MPEFFADTTLVNGAPYPVVNVTDKTFPVPDAERLPGPVLAPEPVRRRASTTPGEADSPAQPGPPMYQVGTEGGFLPGE